MGMLDSVTPTARTSQPEGVHLQRFGISFEYPVYFPQRLFDPANPVLAEVVQRYEPDRRHRIVVFIDEGVAAAWPSLSAAIGDYCAAHAEHLELAATPEVIAGGERVKNDPALVERLQRRLMELGIDRQSYVVAIGGGAMLDAAGYVAATTHRGVRLIRVPTTVLAQNDSGVGVKNGVNAFGIKNFLGTFAPPFAVLNDLDFLATLERRDKIAGLAEAVKVALIRDKAFFGWLENRAANLAAFETTATGYAIRRCAELHMAQIATGGDPFETGSVRPLDYGHWAAHKLETLTGHDLRHGEAVAIGMALDTRYACQIGMIGEDDVERVCVLLERLGFSLWHPALEQRTEDGTVAVLAGLREFREHLGGDLTVTLLEAIGRGVEVHTIDADEVLHAVQWLKERRAVR